MWRVKVLLKLAHREHNDGIRRKSCSKEPFTGETCGIVGQNWGRGTGKVPAVNERAQQFKVPTSSQNNRVGLMERLKKFAREMSRGVTPTHLSVD